MEEDNPWLNTDAVKQVNQRSSKLEIKRTDVKKSATLEESNLKNSDLVTTKNREKVDEGKEKFGILHIDKQNLKEEKTRNFLETLVEHFGNLPKESVEWAKVYFGEEWLNLFLRDVEYLKEDLMSSNFYPSQDKIIFLKYIFLLQQSL